jgi:hypothetical protein
VTFYSASRDSFMAAGNVKADAASTTPRRSGSCAFSIFICGEIRYTNTLMYGSGALLRLVLASVLTNQVWLAIVAAFVVAAISLLV